MPSPEPQPLTAGDTKVCPYCAETIKAAAIKCRYCQSDLTDVVSPLPATPVAGPVAVPAWESPGESAEDESALEEPAFQEPLAERRAARPAGLSTAAGAGLPRVVVVAGLVLVLVLLGLAFRDWRTGSDLTAGNAASRTVQAMVTDKVQGLLSYKYSTFDKDLSAAEKSMTSSFRKKYAPTVAEIRDRAIAQKRSQTADVRAVGVLSETPDEVQALVFVDTLSYRAGSRKRNLMQNRIKVTMVKQNGTWLVDDLEVPQS